MKHFTLIIFLLLACNQENHQKKNIQLEKSLPIQIKSFNKGISILRNNQNLTLFKNANLTKLDEIKTNTNSFLELDLSENTYIRVFPNSNLKIRSQSNFELIEGSYLLYLPKNKTFSTFNILSTNNSILFFQINSQNKLELFVIKGNVLISKNQLILSEKNAILIDNENIEKINFFKLNDSNIYKQFPNLVKSKKVPVILNQKRNLKSLNNTKENSIQVKKVIKLKKENLDEFLKLNPNSEFE